MDVIKLQWSYQYFTLNQMNHLISVDDLKKTIQFLETLSSIFVSWHSAPAAAVLIRTFKSSQMNSCQFFQLLQSVHTSSSERRPIMHSVWSLSLLYLVGVRPVLVLGPVRGVGEGLVAAFVLADVGFLPGVRAQMGLQVLQAGVGLGAALELQRRSLERKFMTGKSFACLIVVDFLCFPLKTTRSWDNQRKHRRSNCSPICSPTCSLFTRQLPFKLFRLFSCRTVKYSVFQNIWGRFSLYLPR